MHVNDIGSTNYALSASDYIIIFDCVDIAGTMLDVSQEAMEHYSMLMVYLCVMCGTITEFYIDLEIRSMHEPKFSFNDVVDDLSLLLSVFTEKDIEKYWEPITAMYDRAMANSITVMPSIMVLSSDRFALRLTGIS